METVRTAILTGFQIYKSQKEITLLNRKEYLNNIQLVFKIEKAQLKNKFH
jgi:hypothetical protein